jgi:hypothetical protein
MLRENCQIDQSAMTNAIQVALCFSMPIEGKMTHKNHISGLLRTGMYLKTYLKQK